MFLNKLAEQSGISSILPSYQKGKSVTEMRDEQLARHLQQQEYKRMTRLRAQYDSERAAESQGVLAKGQRVHYVVKTDTEIKNFEAVVIDVHLDDGPDNPYYTIKYKKTVIIENEDGTEGQDLIEVEKQTQPDRLRRMEWNDDKSWDAIKKKKNVSS